MTNSTDNGPSNMNSPTKSSSLPKAKGPIRTEAVVPTIIIVVATFLYFHFFFDGHIRKAIEWTATYIHGAEVNVGEIRTSVFSGSFFMGDLQVTDKEIPSRNLIEIGEIRFGFLWDALLRAKFVVQDAGIDGIQLYSPRKKPGYVRPPEPPSNKPSAMAEVENQVLDQTKEEFSGNAVGDVASLLGGTDQKELLGNIQGELKSDARIKELQAELKEKERVWKERLQNLPKKEEFDALIQRAKALKFDTKNPKQFADSLKEVGKITKEADSKVDQLKETGTGIKTEIDKFNSEFKQLDELVKKDIEDLEKRLKIPKLDMQDLSKNIFGQMFAKKLASLQKYMVVARKYMPPPKDPNAPKEKELVPPPRGAGKNYRFPITTGYPLFWLKKATISSEPTASGFSGKVSGALTNVTTNPKFVGRPAVLDVRGDFPNSQIFNTELKVTVDHISTPKETLQLIVGAFPLMDQNLVSSSALSLGMKKAQGTSNLVATLQNQEINVDMKNEFKQVEYDLKAQSTAAQEAISSILAGIPSVTLNATAGGSWDHLNLHLNSNLGSELSAGLNRYVQAKIAAMKAKVQDMVDSKIKGEKDKLTAEYAKLKDKVDSVLKTKKDEVEKAKDSVNKQAKSQQSQSQNKMKDDLKEKGKNLLKGLKF